MAYSRLRFFHLLLSVQPLHPTQIQDPNLAQSPHLVAIHEASPSLVGCDEAPVGPSFAQSPTPATRSSQFPHDESWGT